MTRILFALALAVMANGAIAGEKASDPELIKQVMIKDFHLFVNRRQMPVYHEVLNLGLISIEADDWKRVRSITTPAFTTGKLKGMMEPIERIVTNFIKHLGRHAETGLLKK